MPHPHNTDPLARYVCEYSDRSVRRGEACVHVLFAVLLGIGAALLLVHFGAAEGLW